MGRIVGAVLLGYVAMALTVFLGLSLAFVGLGPDRAFRPGVFEVSTLWVAVSVIVGFGAALAGGWVARRIARRATGPRVLAGVVFVLGAALALATLAGGGPEATGPRTEGIGTFEAMQFAQTPFRVMLANPLIGALGVLLGGSALRTEQASATDSQGQSYPGAA
ncbi:MAG: hypothetical protein KFH98_09885 [Gemmatimonadetes bacterium]|nr:hypothetical protein [Gemmatimonadota bacterium]